MSATNEVNEGSAARLRARAIERVAVDRERELIAAPGAGARLVDAAVAEALVGADRLRTLAEHAAAASARLGVAAAQIEAALAELAQAGFMIRREAILEAAASASAREAQRRQGEPSAAAAPLAWVALPTRNRPTTAARAVRSALTHARDHGRTIAGLVMDDTEDPALRQACVRRLAEAASELGLPVYYGDPERKAAFIAALARAGGPARSARFALHTEAGSAACPGANRNAITLMTHGDRLLGIDDDIVCEPARSPEFSAGVRAFSGRGASYVNYNPSQLYFYADRQATLDAVEPAAIDLFAAQEAVLGRPLAAILGEAVDAGEAVDLHELRDPAMLERIVSGRGEVRAAFYGCYGDIGWYTPTWLAFLEGRSRARLTDDPATYLRSTDASREVLRVVPRLTVDDGRYCQTAVIGLDNRGILPPFIPLGRYEDGVFRLSLRTCAPDDYFADLPYALLHDPTETRAFNRADIRRTGDWVRIGELVNQCILASTPTPTSPRERMRALGRGLEELGRASVGELRELLQRRFWAQKSRYLDHLCGLLERFGRAPQPWAEDVAAHIDSCAEALTRPDYVVPREFLLSEGDAERGLVRTRSFIGQLGRLFNEWPALVEAADHLREKGVTLAAPVDPART